MSVTLTQQQLNALGWGAASSARFATAASTTATYNASMTWGTYTTAAAGTNGSILVQGISGPQWVSPKKIKIPAWKKQVRCQGCARWAKVIDVKVAASTGKTLFWVDCERCLGKNPGFIP